MAEQSGFSRDWAILELMGHRRLAGMVQEAELGGASFLRIDIPDGDKFITQFYSPQAVYCITPTTERVAREVAKASNTVPVSKWDVPQLYKAKITERADVEGMMDRGEFEGKEDEGEFCGIDDGDEDD